MGKEDAINSVHDYKKRIERYIEKIKNLKTENANKVLEFHDSLISRGLREATQNKYLERLYSIIQWTKKNFNELTRDELKKIVSEKIDKNSNLTDSTRATYKKILRKFFQWLKDCEDGEFPPEVSWIKTAVRDAKHKQPEEMLNDEDIEKMVKVVNHPRDKAFIITLAESGCRIGEILTLQIKNINFDDKGCFFLVNGKTGTRRVRVVNATPYIHSWLNAHPDKENKDAPLWCVIGTTKNISERISKGDKMDKKYKFNWSFNLEYAAARAILMRAGKLAGIEKPFNPHNFRHSRATALGGNGINEFIMNSVMGWKQGSKMAGTYIHISGKQTDDALLPAIYGMKVEEQKDKHPKMFPIKCINCGELNSYNAKRCNKCNNIIGSIQVSIDEKKREKEFEDMKKEMKEIRKSAYSFKELSQSEDFMEFIKMFKATGGRSKKELKAMREQYEDAEEEQEKEITREMKLPRKEEKEIENIIRVKGK